MNCVIVGSSTQCHWWPGSTTSGAYLRIDPMLNAWSSYCSYNNCGPPCPCRYYFAGDASGAIHALGNVSGSGNLKSIDGSGMGYGVDRNGIHGNNPQTTDPMG